MLECLVNYSKSNEEDYNYVSGDDDTRILWMKVFKFIYDNWEAWEKYKKYPNNRTQFSNDLFGPEYLDYGKETKSKTKFRLGKHREMSGFIIKCYVIPTSALLNKVHKGLPKNQQIDLFTENNLT